MCINCGCDTPNERHKAGDITMHDLEKAAKNHDMDVKKAAENIHKATSKAGASSR